MWRKCCDLCEKLAVGIFCVIGEFFMYFFGGFLTFFLLHLRFSPLRHPTRGACGMDVVGSSASSSLSWLGILIFGDPSLCCYLVLPAWFRSCILVHIRGYCYGHVRFLLVWSCDFLLAWIAMGLPLHRAFSFWGPQFGVLVQQPPSILLPVSFPCAVSLCS